MLQETGQQENAASHDGEIQQLEQGSLDALQGEGGDSELYQPDMAELRPLIGGPGGGGGRSTSPHVACAAGGGGGAILIAANEYIRVQGAITALGKLGGNRGGSAGSCAGPGRTSSSGAIRLVVPDINGTGSLLASGGGYVYDGLIRIEAVNDSFTGDTDPVAIRTAVIGPLVNPVASEIRIAAINDELVPEMLSGPLGGIDFLVPSSGLNAFQVETLGVPAGTTIDLSLKNKASGFPIHETGVVNAVNCDSAGYCNTVITVDLATGAYYVEAQATFQVP